MSLLLNIDTTTETATVSVSKNDLILFSLSNEDKKEHASFLQPAVEELLGRCNLSFKDLAVISVAAGPGSYTGLRVGMASAKGFCYALNIPLITVSSLKVMALSACITSKTKTDSILYCPMIDARRMEVFTALYTNGLNEILEPSAIIVTPGLFEDQLRDNKILFFGSGSLKVEPVITSKNAIFKRIKTIPEALAYLSNEKLKKNIFTNFINNSPLYIKDFYTKI